MWVKSTPLPTSLKVRVDDVSLTSRAGTALLAGLADRVELAPVGQPGVAVIHRVTAPEIGARAFAAGLELHELVPRDVGLEDIFLRLVGEGVGAEVAEPHLEGGVTR